MTDEPDVAHGCLGTLAGVLLIVVVIAIIGTSQDVKTINRWELYGVKVLRSHPTDLPSLQNYAQELLEKDRKEK